MNRTLRLSNNESQAVSFIYVQSGRRKPPSRQADAKNAGRIRYLGAARYV